MKILASYKKVQDRQHSTKNQNLPQKINWHARSIDQAIVSKLLENKKPEKWP